MIVFKNALLSALSVAISPLGPMACEESSHMVTASDKQHMQPTLSLSPDNGDQAGQSQERVGSCVSMPKTVLSQRPYIVQAAVDKVFERIKHAQQGEWFHDGKWGYYTLFGLDEDKVIENIVSTNEADEICLLDVGCARGAWGKEIAEVMTHPLSGWLNACEQPQGLPGLSAL